VGHLTSKRYDIEFLEDPGIDEWANFNVQMLPFHPRVGELDIVSNFVRDIPS
jgi:hypothetical protein